MKVSIPQARTKFLESPGTYEDSRALYTFDDSRVPGRVRRFSSGAQTRTWILDLRTDSFDESLVSVHLRLLFVHVQVQV